jgi:hypothetical protein
MIKNALLEMTLGSSAKETANKLRWDALVDGVTFSLYIPKWRVPNPWPGHIWVLVLPRRQEGDDLPNLSKDDVEADSTTRKEPIVATVSRYSEHTETVRYTPGGDRDDWEIGEPYVPRTIAGEHGLLRLIIMWDITSRGAFVDFSKVLA